MEYTEIQKLTEDSIRKEFRKNNLLICTVPYVNSDSDMIISRFLRVVLVELNQEKLFSYLEYAQNELCMNASKANSKRIYFQAKGMDIHNSADYEKGMIRFKKDVFGNFDSYKAAHKDNNSYVRIRYENTGDFLEIEILNNSPMVEEEKLRIAERIKIARKFESFADVLAHGFDETEGAGYGLIIILQMLRKVNLDEKNLSFRNVGDSSSTLLRISLSALSREQGYILAEEIVSEIERMPQFPENIQRLQKELSNPACTFESVSDTVTSDPSLVTEILRIANSPVYRLNNKISDVAAAVRMIGMLGVKSILYNFGIRKVFEKRYNIRLVKEIHEHSFHVALMASFLARYKGIQSLAEDIYTAALIHDLGKVIISSLQTDLEDKLEKLCTEKHIPITLLEELAEGYNHALIGAELAEKWDFPEKFIQAIRHHHNPLGADADYKVIVYAVYLGNEIFYFNKKERDFQDLNHVVLQFFGIEEKNKFMNFLEELKAEGLSLSL
ncbi:MAG: hypothetical protein B6241_15165 [Spirochaetaceae bacterium 4572_59]|nr:MAG: hypothetical protein B6241_15165 [Spirochaetaceae bacterium 4572_59]